MAGQYPHKARKCGIVGVRLGECNGPDKGLWNGLPSDEGTPWQVTTSRAAAGPVKRPGPA